MKKTLFLIAALASATLLSAKQAANKDEEAIKAVVATLQNGWNNKNGETFSSVFAETHDYIVVNGLYFSGWNPKANAAAHQGLFNGIYKDMDIKLKLDKISFVRPDLAMVTIIGASAQKGQLMPEDPGIIMTLLVEKKGEDWKIISFHNHALAVEKNRTPMPMIVMYASWYKN